MERLGLDREKGWKNQKIHLHVPAGAVPKDGPSAGITLTTALVSLLSGRSVRPDIAMTGEVTLQGQVLPVGGVKLKTLAAHRTGIKTLILPKLNEVDLDELPDEVREDMDFVLVEDVQDVLENALAPEKKPEKEEGPADLEAAKAKSSPAAERAPAPASP